MGKGIRALRSARITGSHVGGKSLDFLSLSTIGDVDKALVARLLALSLFSIRKSNHLVRLSDLRMCIREWMQDGSSWPSRL